MAIDRSSGIPLDDTSLIEQIPLGGQVFPFADWDATARPRRNPIYGDDVLPTSALVAGQLPDHTAPQSVHTDGKHALLVKDVSEGGGSLTQNDLFNVNVTQPMYDEGPFTGSGQMRMTRISGGTRLYRVQGEIYVLVPGSSNPFLIPANMQVLATDVTQTDILLCLAAFILGPADSSQEQRRYTFESIYPGGIDLSSVIPANTDWTTVISVSDDTQVFWTITVFVGPS